jgi:hypothetical protein
MNWDPYLQIRRDALESIDQLRLTRYRDELAPELANYERFFQELVPHIQEELNSPNERSVYESLKEFYSEVGIQKAIHFSHYNNFKNPSIFVMENIILESLRLLANIIELHEAGRRTFPGGFQRRWIDSYNDRIEALVRHLSQNLPCAEGYISSLQATKLELEAGPPEEAEPVVIAAVKMKPTNFTSDGDFSLAVTAPIFKDFQLIGLSMHAFKKALCGAIDNCAKGAAGEQPAVLAAFNLDNYKLFLEAIEFYGNDRYGTSSIPDFETLEALVDAYGLSFPSPDTWGDPPHCCQATLRAALRTEGGRRRKTRRHKRAHRKVTKRNRLLRRK